ncbi:MAG TPA: recombination mediator RecR [Dehalococcoidales bacterium]|nr:recombination mediator RecR [Dehalococcoidales bacterium]
MSRESSATTEAVTRLIQELHKLPGIGPKSAQRIAFYLLRSGNSDNQSLADAILQVKQKTQLCSVCLNVSETLICRICSSDSRDKTKICVVEQPQDILALEHTRKFNGLYHVLHGALSPSDGIKPDDLRILELMERLKSGIVTEIIMATNTNLEGEQTALYLHRIITPLNIKVTRLARGLPFGTELEYADDITLSRALEGRQEF